MSVIFQETFAGIRVVKSFAQEDYQVAQFDKSSEIQCRNSMKVRKSMEMVGPLDRIHLGLRRRSVAMLYVYFFNVDMLKLGLLCIGLFMLYDAGQGPQQNPHANAEVHGLGDEHLRFAETKASHSGRSGCQSLSPNARAAITLDKVNFSYGHDKTAVERYRTRYRAPAKNTLWWVPAARGKSTLISLIQRFYDPAERRDQSRWRRDIRTITQQSLRQHIGMVTQDTFLFHDTIYENIRYGRLDATKAEVEAAAKLAYAHEFILAQQEGYDTIVGDKGCHRFPAVSSSAWPSPAPCSKTLPSSSLTKRLQRSDSESEK